VDATHTCLCSAPECGNPAKKRGLCGTHYMRLRRTGSVGTAPIQDSAVQTLADRFWSKVDKNGPIVRAELGPCRIWTAATNEHGYGVIRPSGKRNGPALKTHRLSAEWADMDIEGKFVLHSCDNRRCVNPAHLRAGSAKQNSVDMVKRDRACRGEDRPQSKLTDEKVLEAHRRVANGELHRVVAADLGVSRSRITTIVNGRGWQHVTPPAARDLGSAVAESLGHAVGEPGLVAA
jgi:hypothetical protein